MQHSHGYYLRPCLSHWLDFLQWWTVTWECKIKQNLSSLHDFRLWCLSTKAYILGQFFRAFPWRTYLPFLLAVCCLHCCELVTRLEFGWLWCSGCCSLVSQSHVSLLFFFCPHKLENYFVHKHKITCWNHFSIALNLQIQLETGIFRYHIL